MYNDLYLETLETDIFIESIDLIFSNIDINDKLSLILEDGSNDKKSNIIMRTVDAIVKKIKEIIDWIKSKLFGNDNKKYEDFLKLADSKVSGLYVEFDKSPKKVYELYYDIYEVISKKYDKLSGNDDYSNFIEEIKDKLDKDVKKERVSPKECLDLMYKYEKLSLHYKGLSNEISNDIWNKSKRGINCSQEQKTLSLIARILNDIRNNMTKISPRKISTNSSIISKVKRWAKDNPGKAASIIISLTSIGAIAGMGAGINAMKNHTAHTKAEQETSNENHKNTLKTLAEKYKKINELSNNPSSYDNYYDEIEKIHKQYDF